MTVAVADIVTPAAIVPSSADVATLAAGLLVDRPLFGRVSDVANAPEIRVDWNNGNPSAVGVNTFTTTDIYATHNDSLRFVAEAAAATVTAFRGRVVQLASPASSEFSGLVVAVFSLELATTGKPGGFATVDVVLFRTRSGEYVLAAATDVAVVPGQ